MTVPAVETTSRVHALSRVLAEQPSAAAPSRVLADQPSASALRAIGADDTSDAELVQAMLRKDRAAWRTFYDRFDALASRCIARVVARFARTGAADDVGEIQAKLRLQLCSNDMAKLRSFDERRGRKLSSWVGLLAVNCAYDHLRAARRERARASLDECDDLRADAPAADDLLDWKQRAGIVRDLCADLSEKDRAFVALYFGEGLEVTEVAARLGISVKTVYSKKHKIQRRIEARLTPRRGAHRHGAASIDGLCAAA